MFETIKKLFKEEKKEEENNMETRFKDWIEETEYEVSSHIDKEEKKDEFRAYIVENLSLKPKLEAFCKCYEVNGWYVPEIPLNKFGHLFCDENEKLILQNDVQRKFVVFSDDFYKEYNFEDANDEICWKCSGEIKLLKNAFDKIYAIAGDKELVIKFIKYLNKNF